MKLFITGTDTDIGKTFISASLLKGFANSGKSTVALKPLASGSEQLDKPWQNIDALTLQQQATVKLPYAKINPIIYPSAIAPHIAAVEQHDALSVEKIYQASQPALSVPADVHLIEGVGGWYVPLNTQESMADVVKRWECQVILVVGMRLGCLNHAILTAQAIAQSGLNLLGWVGLPIVLIPTCQLLMKILPR